MRPIPQKLRNRIDQDPYYRRCSRSREGTCSGRITIEHAIIVAGRQLSELWALLPICAFHHAVDQFQGCGDLKKDLNHLIAYERATEADFAKYQKSRSAWEQERDYLRTKYPEYASTTLHPTRDIHAA